MNTSTVRLITVLGGLLSATLSLAYQLPFPGLILFSYLASLPLFLIGLGMGLRPLYGAGLIATLLVFIITQPLLGLEFFIFSVLGPVFLVNRALLNRKTSEGKVSWYPSSFLLRDITLISGAVMLLALGGYLYFIQGSDIHSLVKTFLKAFDPQGQMGNLEPMLLIIFPLLPGFIAFSWIIMMLANAALAQGLLVRFNRNLRPTPSFIDLEVPHNFLILLGISLLLSLIGVGSLELVGKNATFILTFPFLLTGLGLVHQWLHKTRFPTIALTIFYVILFLFFWLGLFVILLGILKPWIEKLTHSN